MKSISGEVDSIRKYHSEGRNFACGNGFGLLLDGFLNFSEFSRNVYVQR